MPKVKSELKLLQLSFVGVLNAGPAQFSPCNFIHSLVLFL
jgi:hypothetical protein